MKWNWRKIGTGLRVALGIAIKLNDAHIIKVKELDTVKTVKEIIEKEVKDAKPRTPTRIGIAPPADEGDTD